MDRSLRNFNHFECFHVAREWGPTPTPSCSMPLSPRERESMKGSTLDSSTCDRDEPEFSGVIYLDQCSTIKQVPTWVDRRAGVHNHRPYSICYSARGEQKGGRRLRDGRKRFGQSLLFSFHRISRRVITTYLDHRRHVPSTRGGGRKEPGKRSLGPRGGELRSSIGWREPRQVSG